MENRGTTRDAFEAEKVLPQLFEQKTHLFQILFVKKMSNCQGKVKRGSVNGSAAEKGSGNAAGIVWSTTRSGVSFSQAPNVSGSRVMMKKAVKPVNKRKANANAERTENGNNKQFLDTSSVYPSMAGRATGMLPLLFTNSSRKARSPSKAGVQPSKVEMK